MSAADTRAACPRCGAARMVRHGERRVQRGRVDGAGVAWTEVRFPRLLCRSCGKASDEPGHDDGMDAVKGHVAGILAREGPAAAGAAAGVTGRTAEAWAESAAAARLGGPLPPGILLAVSGRLALVLDASDGVPLDACAADEADLEACLAARGGPVARCWVVPRRWVADAALRACPDAEVLVPGFLSRPRLDAALSALDVAGGTAEARLLAARVAATGWDGRALALLRSCRPGIPAELGVFLSFWTDETLAGLAAPDPARPRPVPAFPSVVRARAWIAFEAPSTARGPARS